MKIEIWKDIIGYEGLYQVSNYGNVKSLNYNKTGKEKILKPQITKDGYCRVLFSHNNKHKQHSVHRLVCTAFIPNPNNYPCVNHKSEDKTDNRVENLEWCTIAFNNSYGTRLEKVSNVMKGRKHTQEHIEKCAKALQKPIVQIDKNGLIIGMYDSIIQIERELGINNSSITKCCKGKQKFAGGYRWMYLTELKKAG